MSFKFKFSNLLGTVYRHGNICFTSDGLTVICPVGNKMSMYDVKNNVSKTLPVESRYNYECFAISPDGKIIISSVEDGKLDLISLYRAKVIYEHKFDKPAKCIKFSPDGKYFAIAKDNLVNVYLTPQATKTVKNGFILKKTFCSAHAEVTCIDWHQNSSTLVYGSNDMTAHVGHIKENVTVHPATVGGSSNRVIGAYFLKNSYDVLIVNKQGYVICSKAVIEQLEDSELLTKQGNKQKKSDDSEESDDNVNIIDESEDNEKGTIEEYRKKKKVSDKNKIVIKSPLHYPKHLKTYLNDKIQEKTAIASSCCFHQEMGLVAVGFSTGEFIVALVGDSFSSYKIDVIQVLRVENRFSSITAMEFNATGDWLSIGSSREGQLIVWEWRSETYLLKQQGQFNNINVVAYSPDGVNLATGGEDGKVKLWSTHSYFCFLTRADHESAVTGIVFTQTGRAVLSSSLDGSVRAFDLIRYRNFKTLTPTRPAQLSCVAVDSNGQLVASGSRDLNEIFVWSLQTGDLLEILGGHSGPVVHIQFSASLASTTMISTAWDKSVKIWDAVETSTAKESFTLLSDGVCVALRPDDKQLAVATMDCQISFIDTATASQTGSINGKHSLVAGRADEDKISANKNKRTKYFTTICYSPDGTLILAAGQSKSICIYNVESELLLKRFEITQNRSFDAMDEIINRRKMAKNGVNLNLIEQRGDLTDERKIALPGVRRGDQSMRSFKPEVRVTSLAFSATGRSFAACSTEGLLIYSLDDDWRFDPMNVDEDCTPDAARKKLQLKEYLTALIMTLKLNIDSLMQECIESIPTDAIPVVIGSMNEAYCERLLNILAKLVQNGNHLGVCAEWCSHILMTHGMSLKNKSRVIISTLNNIKKVFTKSQTDLSRGFNHSVYEPLYLKAQNDLKKRRQLTTEEVDKKIVELEDDKDLFSSDDEMDF